MKKRTIHMLMSLVVLTLMIFSIKGISYSYANEIINDNNIKYVIKNNQATVEKYLGSAQEVIIPESVKGYKVTTIGYKAFENCTTIKKVKIPNTVNSIESAAFAECTNLTTVNIPDGIKIINNWTFTYCFKLDNVKIPKGVIEIGERAFATCQNLKNIELPEGIKTIGEGAFESCLKLESIKIPKSVSYIGIRGFANCDKLKSIIIPDGVKSIEQYTFANCGNLKEMTIPSSVTEIYHNGMPSENKGLVIYGDYSSTASSFADDMNITFKFRNPINAKKLNIFDIKDQIYTGKEIKPKLTVRMTTDVLTEGKDYKLSYTKSKDIGTATVKIIGIGNYTGETTKTFKIIPKTTSKVIHKNSTASKIQLSWNKVSGVSGYKIYSSTSKNGVYKCIANVKGEGTTTYTDSKLKSCKTYYYKVRPYKIVEKKTYEANYSSVLVASTKCDTPTIKVNSSKSKTAKVTWNKISGASGYKVYRSTSKNGSYKCVQTIKNNSTTNFTDKNLKSKKTYYYKVVACKNLNGYNANSAYSSVKSVKVK